jgi:hypothetical protein
MRIIYPLAAVALAIVAWTGFWFYSANRLERSIDDWIAAKRTAGWDITHDGIEIGGYPYRLRVDVNAPHISWPNRPGAPAWQADRLATIAHPWNLNHVLADLTGRHVLSKEIDGARRRVAIVSEEGAASLTGAFRPEKSLSVDLKRVDIAVDDRPNAHIDRWQLHLRPGQRTGDLQDFALIANNLKILEPAGLPFGQTAELVAVQGTLTGSIPPGGTRRERTAQWRDDGGAVEFERIRIAWGDVGADISGALALDAEFRPIGAMTAKIKGHDRLIDAAAAAGQLPKHAVQPAKVALGLLAAANGGTLSVPLSMQDGTVFLGPVEIARLSPLF